MDWATFWTAVGGSSPAVAAGVATVRTFIKRVAAEANKPLETDVAQIKAQFGSNGGGLRQAVNEIAVDVGVLKVQVGDLKSKVDTLRAN